MRWDGDFASHIPNSWLFPHPRKFQLSPLWDLWLVGHGSSWIPKDLRQEFKALLSRFDFCTRGSIFPTKSCISSDHFSYKIPHFLSPVQPSQAPSFSGQHPSTNTWEKKSLQNLQPLCVFSKLHKFIPYLSLKPKPASGRPSFPHGTLWTRPKFRIFCLFLIKFLRNLQLRENPWGAQLIPGGAGLAIPDAIPRNLTGIIIFPLPPPKLVTRWKESSVISQGDV